MTCIENGQYLRLQVRIIGGTDGFYLGQASIYNVTHERKNPSLRRVDRLPRNILKLYNGLYYLNGRQDTFEVFRTLSPAVTEGQVYRGIDTLLQAYALHLSMNVCKKRFRPGRCLQLKCYKVLAGSDVPCEGCINGELRRDCFYTAIRHNRKNGRNLLMRATLIPWHGKDYRFTTAIDMNQYISRDLAENHVIFREAMANDVIAIGMREADPDKGLQKINPWALRSYQSVRTGL